MLEASGYVRDGDYVAVDGFDFEAYHLANRARMLEVRENLHPEEAASVIAFVDVVMAAKAEGVEDVSDWARKQIKEDPQAFAGLAEPPAAAAALELLSELDDHDRSEEHTSELQSLMRNSYAVFCLNKKKTTSKK